MNASDLVVFYAAFCLGGIGLFLASLRKPKAVRRERAIKFIVYFLIIHVVIGAVLGGHWSFSTLVGLLSILGGRELAAATRRAEGNLLRLRLAVAAVYVPVATCAVVFAWRASADVAIFVYLVVCAFDGFSQVAGQLVGRIRLAPRISPGKTVEGSVGGWLAAIGIGLLLRPLAGWTWPRSVAVVCLIAAASLTGDLLASLVKRRCDLKEYGGILPGHGGILDRFDSFFFTAATLTLFQIF